MEIRDAIEGGEGSLLVGAAPCFPGHHGGGVESVEMMPTPPTRCNRISDRKM
jgi:hypothetical protein